MSQWTQIDGVVRLSGYQEPFTRKELLCLLLHYLRGDEGIPEFILDRTDHADPESLQVIVIAGGVRGFSDVLAVRDLFAEIAQRRQIAGCVFTADNGGCVIVGRWCEDQQEMIVETYGKEPPR